MDKYLSQCYNNLLTITIFKDMKDRKYLYADSDVFSRLTYAQKNDGFIYPTQNSKRLIVVRGCD